MPVPSSEKIVEVGDNAACRVLKESRIFEGLYCSVNLIQSGTRLFDLGVLNEDDINTSTQSLDKVSNQSIAIALSDSSILK